MCWITNKKLKFKIAKENIPIYKICRKVNDEIFAYYQPFEYKLGWMYETNFEIAFGTKMSEIYKGFHSYSPNKTYYIRENNTDVKVEKYSSIIDIIMCTNYSLSRYKNSIVVSGYIPKGGAYALNEYGEYVSDSIILNKIENA